ncbi:hypothetical protein Tco_1380529 [Tanacetum coccineum]
MAKKSSIPAVDLSADDDNIEDEEDVVMTTTAPTQTFVRWTRDEEKLLCEVWVGVSENNGSGSMKDVLNEELCQKIQAGKSAYEAKKLKNSWQRS